MATPVRSAFMLLVLPSVACSGNDFDPPSEVRGVRVLAVRPAAPADAEGRVPASGSPGETLSLDMLYVDGRAPLSTPGSVPALPNLWWLGGCHNPPSRLYYGCSPVLRAIAQGIAADPSQPVPPGIFGTESPFAVPLPPDILSSAPRLATDPLHFGVSYVFFGVCSGSLRPRPDRTEGLPLDCVDPATNQALGPEDFVVGFTTLYTYEGVRNMNPELAGVRFDGNAVSGPDCVEPGSCSRVVPACAKGEECPAYRIEPDVSAPSFETMPDGSFEVSWVSYYATGGGIAKESQLASDRVTGRVADFTSSWRAPSTPGTYRLWVTVNDERGGAHWASFDVVVE